MSGAPLSYIAITPARDEVDNLPRLAACIAAQTVRPAAWIIVDNGSTDGTAELAALLAERDDRILFEQIAGSALPVRGAPIVRALHAGFARTSGLRPEIVVALDADVSFGPRYFECLLAAFAADPRLGIASGSCWERERGRWRRRHVTGSTVWGATRAYRRACLEDVVPLEERLGWDGIDQVKANARGWTTRTLVDLPFYHHRPEGNRGGRWLMRVEQGRLSHYLGYRPWYLVARATYQAYRHPSALGLVWGFAGAHLARADRLADRAAVRYVRRQQSIRLLPRRVTEALGLRRSSGGRGARALRP